MYYLTRKVSHALTYEKVDRVGAESSVYEMTNALDECYKQIPNSSNHFTEYAPIDR